jgi:hypothetical protein
MMFDRLELGRVWRRGNTCCVLSFTWGAIVTRHAGIP